MAEKREEDIRPCVGMGYCIDFISARGWGLTHNPATGREGTMPHVVRPLPVRAAKSWWWAPGPAGSRPRECRRVRGHEVVGVRGGRPAGRPIRIAAGLARRREILGIVDWRVQQCDKRARFRLDTYAEEAEVLAENPDIVVIATGGIPNTSFLDFGEDLVTTSWDILTGGVRPAETVIVYDDNGAHPGMTAAEFIAGSRPRLEIVTPERMLPRMWAAPTTPPISGPFRNTMYASPSI